MSHNSAKPNHYARNILLVFLLAVQGLTASGLKAQSPELADSLTQNYMKLFRTNQETDLMYRKLYNSYKAWLTVLRYSPRASANYEKARLALVELAPHLRNAAAHYSQKHDELLSTLFACSYVDIAVDPEMKQKRSQIVDDYYPNMVHFAAGHCYNSAHFKEAIKYLGEYLKYCGDTERANNEGFYAQAQYELKHQTNPPSPFRLPLPPPPAAPDTVYDYVGGDSVARIVPPPVVEVEEEIKFEEIPDYRSFSYDFRMERFKNWSAQDPYENDAEYKQRVTQASSKAKWKELDDACLQEYVERYTLGVKGLERTDLTLMKYDPNNETFLIRSVYGPIVLNVPRANNVARNFESNWNGVQVANPKFGVDNRDRLLITDLTFITPDGQTYHGNNKGQYQERREQLPQDILASLGGSSVAEEGAKITLVSDVDKGLPQAKSKSPDMYALIISNEEYDYADNVPMASHDGEMFALYCKEVLGMPDRNVLFYKNATRGHMRKAVSDLKKANKYNNGMSVLFYYAGHGVPDANTGKAYLLPTDVDPTAFEDAIALGDLYRDLSTLNANSVVAFLDACFSGAKRGGGSVFGEGGRAVMVKPNTEQTGGKLVVFSAASESEMAYPYTSQGHGMFTYYLLKKLKETQGKVTLDELGTYLMNQVSKTSYEINKKDQHPTVNPSPSLGNKWKKLKIKP